MRAREALRTRRVFNVIDPETAFKIDLIIRKERPFSREEFSRRQQPDLGVDDLWHAVLGQRGSSGGG